MVCYGVEGAGWMITERRDGGGGGAPFIPHE
jgi:hypothetical protein